MPQLNVAPSPVVAPPAAANAASPESAASGSPADGVPEQPFAAVLQRQVSQQNASRHPGDKSGTQSQTTDKPLALSADTPPADALAAIAQMLAGIAPPPPTGQGQAPQEAAEPVDGGKGKKAATDEGAGPVVVAAPTPQAFLAATMAREESERSDAASSGSPTALGSGVAAKQAEILAAEPQAAASAAAPGKEDKDFASLLAAAPQAAAAEQSVKAHAAAAQRSEGTARIETPVGARGWDNEFGEKLTWLVNKHETRADLVLNPPELGRIEVSISMKGDQASATFVSANPAVRDAIESAVPRLREVLQDAGISLGQTQVGAESFQQQQSAASRENGDNSWRGGNSDASGSEAVANGALSGTSPVTMRGNGLVDTFA